MSKKNRATDVTEEPSEFIVGEVVTPYTHTKLNVREKPEKNGKVITTLYDKTHVTIDSSYNGKTWLKIVKPVVGYVSKDYVEVR